MPSYLSISNYGDSISIIESAEDCDGIKHKTMYQSHTANQSNAEHVVRPTKNRYEDNTHR